MLRLNYGLLLASHTYSSNSKHSIPVGGLYNSYVQVFLVDALSCYLFHLRHSLQVHCIKRIFWVICISNILILFSCILSFNSSQHECLHPDSFTLELGGLMLSGYAWLSFWDQIRYHFFYTDLGEIARHLFGFLISKYRIYQLNFLYLLAWLFFLSISQVIIDIHPCYLFWVQLLFILRFGVCV